MKNWIYPGYLGCLAAATALFACGSDKPPSAPTATSASEQAASQATPAAKPEQKGLRLYAFECGQIMINDISLFHPGTGKGEKKRFAASCYLIEHPKGTLEWDTGISDELVKKPEGVTNPIATMQVKKTLASQYQAISVAPDSINYLAISHMHSDHCGNANLFPHATLLMQKEEYEAAFSPDPSKFHFDPTAYPTLKANPVKKLEGDYDVFGDGTVVIKRALGHTPGHQVLFVKLPKTGNILLSGDMAHFTENWKNRGVPAFNFDKEQTVKTMNDIDAFMQANHAQLWIQHDYEQNQTIKHAPEYYE